jgi:hypothetical protein
MLSGNFLQHHAIVLRAKGNGAVFDRLIDEGLAAEARERSEDSE